jgi:hypothetical protein
VLFLHGGVPVKIFVSAGFSEILHPEVAARCQSVARGIRTGLAVNDEHPMVAELVRDTLRYFDEAIFIIGGWDWRIGGKLIQDRDADLEPQGQHLANQCESLIAEWGAQGGDTAKLWIEIGNELDGSRWKEDLRSFYRIAMKCYERVRSVSDAVHVITGSTMNLNKEWGWKRGGFEVLDELCKMLWPKDTIQGLHPYRGGGRFWPSFDSEAEALEELRRILRGRELAITEMGWASGTGHTDEAIAAMMREEIAMWRAFGARCFVTYQVQDAPAPGNVGEGGFGVFSALADGLIEKPVGAALREARA